VNGDVEPGYHEVDFNGGRISSGVYFYRIQAGGYVKAMKLMLIR